MIAQRFQRWVSDNIEPEPLQGRQKSAVNRGQWICLAEERGMGTSLDSRFV
jgi:hypothetical protein